MRTTFLSVILLNLTCAHLAVTPVRSGSHVPDPLLAVTSEVRVAVPEGFFAYEPIPGLDDRALARAIRQRCEKALHRAGIEVSDSAEAYLLVSIRHAWSGQKRDMVALLTRLTLEFPASPKGAMNQKLLDRDHSFPIWSAQSLELVPSTRASEIILESIDLALKELIESRKSAQPAEGEDCDGSIHNLERTATGHRRP